MDLGESLSCSAMSGRPLSKEKRTYGRTVVGGVRDISSFNAVKEKRDDHWNERGAKAETVLAIMGNMRMTGVLLLTPGG